MIIKNAKIVLENKIIDKGWIEIENEVIKSINEGNTALEGIDVNSNWLLPGFIDCHVHGGYGVDFETGTIEGYLKFAKLVAQEGITSYVQASVTNSKENNLKYLKVFQEFMKNQELEAAKCLGSHLEGPFISPEKKGAHELGLLEKPNIAIMQELITASNNNIALVTYAPDLQNGEFTKFLLQNKIIPSAGHTNISFKDCQRDYDLGLQHVTHLFNGMSGVSQYDPGLASWALYKDEVLCEVITDGIHIHPDTLKLIYKIKTPDNICIITDAMNAKGLRDGEYKLGNLDVVKIGMKVALKESGLLAGAGATYDHNVRVMKEAIGDLTMNNLIKMTSINIAKQLNIFKETGSIAIGKKADLVVLDQSLYVGKTIVNGRIVYEK